MKTFDNELIINRNEQFTLDKWLENKDGSPYIFSMNYKNPYILITVADSKYSQQARYVYNKWLDLNDFPRFNCTTPLNILDIKTQVVDFALGNVEYSKYTSFQQILSDFTSEGKISGYINNEYIELEPCDYVLYNPLENDKYWYYNENTQQLEEYNTRLITTFFTDITRDWIEQTYYYSYTLVTGELIGNYLKQLANSNNITYSNNITDKELYNLLKENNIIFADNFSINRPILVEHSEPILLPTKITVISNIEGGL